MDVKRLPGYLKLTFLAPKNGWNLLGIRSFPFGAKGLVSGFSGAKMLVSGRGSYLSQENGLFDQFNPLFSVDFPKNGIWFLDQCVVLSPYTPEVRELKPCKNQKSSRAFKRPVGWVSPQRECPVSPGRLMPPYEHRCSCGVFKNRILRWKKIFRLAAPFQQMEELCM